MATVAVPSGRRHDLGKARQRRNSGEPRLLGQEGDQLELRVQPGFETPVGLDEDPFADNDRGVRLVGAERALVELAHRAGPARYQPDQRRPGPANECRRDGSRAAARAVRRRGDARDRPPVGDRGQQGAPRPVAVPGRAQWVPGQGEGIAVRAPVVELETGDGEDVRHLRLQDEGVLEGDGADRPPLRAEPARAGELAEVEAGECRRDGGAIELDADRIGVRTDYVPELIITCLTNV